MAKDTWAPTKTLGANQQHWSREPRASGRPTWGGASYNGAVESTNSMTKGQNGSEGAWYHLAYLRQEELCWFCCFGSCINAVTKTTHSWSFEYLRSWSRKNVRLKDPFLHEVAIRTGSHLSADFEGEPHFLEVITTEASDGVLAGAWRSQALRQWHVHRHLVIMI